MKAATSCGCQSGQGCRACADVTPRFDPPRVRSRWKGNLAPLPPWARVDGGVRGNLAPKRQGSLTTGRVSDQGGGMGWGPRVDVPDVDVDESCVVEDSHPWDSQPSSARLNLTASRFDIVGRWPPKGSPYGEVPSVTISEDDVPFNILLPDDVAHLIVPAYRRGRWDSGASGFAPTMDYEIRRTRPSGAYVGSKYAYKVKSQFREYVDYCSYVGEVLNVTVQPGVSISPSYTSMGSKLGVAWPARWARRVMGARPIR